MTNEMTEQEDLHFMRTVWYPKMLIVEKNIHAIYTTHLPILTKWIDALWDLSEDELEALNRECAKNDPYDIDSQCKHVAILRCMFKDDEDDDQDDSANSI